MRWQGQINADAADGANRPERRIVGTMAGRTPALPMKVLHSRLYDRQIQPFLSGHNLRAPVLRLSPYIYSACQYVLYLCVTFFNAAIVLSFERVLKPGTVTPCARPLSRRICSRRLQAASQEAAPSQLPPLCRDKSELDRQATRNYLPGAQRQKEEDMDGQLLGSFQLVLRRVWNGDAMAHKH